jgi:hypothetical protein
MKLEFTKVKHTKTNRLLEMLQDGERGNMDYFAKKLGTNNDVVRGLICLLRKRGYKIFNRVVEGTTRQTQYFLVKRGMQEQLVINKVHHTMDVPHGTHLLKVS